MRKSLVSWASELSRPLPQGTPAVFRRGLTITSTKPFTNTTAQIEPIPTAQPPVPRSPKPKRLPPTSATSISTPLQPLSQSVRKLLPLLRSQPAHYIAVHIHGFPYLVTVGDQVRLPARIPCVVPGDVLRLNRASVIGSRDYTLKGTPFVDESLYQCRAIVVGVEAEPMQIIVKKKQRCRRKTTYRNKMRFTVLRISELTINPVGGVEANTS